MIHILWFSNRAIITNDIKASGSWLSAMASNISKRDDIFLTNITKGNVKNIQHIKDGKIEEYILPNYPLNNGLPSKEKIDLILACVKKSTPDLIHIWGVEGYWGLLKARGYLNQYKVLLEIQGVLYMCHHYYKADLHLSDFIRFQGIIKGIYSYIFVSLQKYKMKRRSVLETEIISSCENIGYQSNWTYEHIKVINPYAYFHFSKRALRNEFSKEKWTFNSKHNIVTILSSQTYKGFHVTLQALSILRKDIPDIHLYAIGIKPNKSLRGNDMFQRDLIKYLNLENHITLLGPLNAQKMIQYMSNSSCIVISSFVESYSLVLAESLAYGIPCVVSKSCALANLVEENKTALMFTPGDYVACADRIKQIIDHPHIAFNLHNMLQEQNNIALEKIDIANYQINIYNNILKQYKEC